MDDTQVRAVHVSKIPGESDAYQHHLLPLHPGKRVLHAVRDYQVHPGGRTASAKPHLSKDEDQPKGLHLSTASLVAAGTRLLPLLCHLHRLTLCRPTYLPGQSPLICPIRLRGKLHPFQPDRASDQRRGQ